jgi:hypothetical protein
MQRKHLRRVVADFLGPNIVFAVNLNQLNATSLYFGSHNIAKPKFGLLCI